MADRGVRVAAVDRRFLELLRRDDVGLPLDPSRTGRATRDIRVATPAARNRDGDDGHDREPWHAAERRHGNLACASGRAPCAGHWFLLCNSTITGAPFAFRPKR